MWFFLINKTLKSSMCFSRESILRDTSLKRGNFFLLFSCLLLLLSDSVSDPVGKSTQVGFMLSDSEGTASRPYYLLPKEIPHYGTFDCRGIRCNSILWNKIYVVRSRDCHMQLFSGRPWLPLDHTTYADRKRNLSQLDFKDRILSAISYSFNLEK